MKSIMFKISCCLLLCAVTICSCKKSYNPPQDIKTGSNIITQEYTYNTATKKFTPTDDIKIDINSPVSVRLIYHYLMREGRPDSIISTFYDSTGNNNSFSITLPASRFADINMSNATGIRMMIKHTDNSYDEKMVKITSFTPKMPELSGFSETITPDDNDQLQLTGTAYSENGIKRIDILDDATGSFTVAHSITNLNNEQNYNLNYIYTYRPNARNLRIVVVDNFDLAATVTIRMPVLPYEVYQDVNMGAQGTASVTVNNNIFFAETGTTLGSCEIPANEAAMDFLFYGTGSGPTFYSPANTTNVAANFRCNGTGWTIGNTAALKATKFRVLVPGSSAAVDNVYAKYTANAIDNLDNDGLFEGIAIPSGSTARYTAPPAEPTTGIFNTTTAYLIWVRIPKSDGNFRNCLLRAKEAVVASATGLSTVKFDILVQK